jgi:hypothetical protein
MNEIPRFTERDKAVIRSFAGGDTSRRAEAIAIFNASLRTHGVDHRDPYFEFMSETCTSVPCWVLRSKARAEILDRPWP